MIIIFTNPSAQAGYDTRSVFKRSLTGLNSEFSFSKTSCLTKAEEPCLSYYLPIAGGRIIGFIPFPRALVLCEMQSVSSRIWTRVTVSISCDDNHYTTGTSNYNDYGERKCKTKIIIIKFQTVSDIVLFLKQKKKRILTLLGWQNPATMCYLCCRTLMYTRMSQSFCNILVMGGTIR